ncbi:hypothetical protein [Aquimarina rhabdastrellae]
MLHRLKTNLKSKLQHAKANIAIDLFGVEKQIHQHANTYIEVLAKELNLPKSQLLIRVFPKKDTFDLAIYHQGKLIKPIILDDLLLLFADKEQIQLLGLQERIPNGILNFVQNYAIQENIPQKHLHLGLCVRDQKLSILIYNRAQFLAQYPLHKWLNFIK